ncbi:hypothetical protein [Nocardia niwae]|uniref:Uncharacterized protein n=1 Tax=Nocardia niwae TaxID=626084 RepID=A0ABV2XCM0_9NOCA|nr:hypothetical protein [Nocardia niwae]
MMPHNFHAIAWLKSADAISPRRHHGGIADRAWLREHLGRFPDRQYGLVGRYELTTLGQGR